MGRAVRAPSQHADMHIETSLTAPVGGQHSLSAVLGEVRRAGAEIAAAENAGRAHAIDA